MRWLTILLSLAFFLPVSAGNLNAGPGTPGERTLSMPSRDTLRYDDDYVSSVGALPLAGDGYGMRFANPGGNVTLAGALINFYDNSWPVPGGNRVLVQVYADDGANRAPGTRIWTSDTLTIVRGDWNYIPVGAPISAHAFYIFTIQARDLPYCAGLSIDGQNNAPGHCKWRRYSGGFSEDDSRGDWMIRAIVDRTPQGINAAPLAFIAELPVDTLPGTVLSFRVLLGNLGANSILAGTPVQLRVYGPQGYAYSAEYRTYMNLAPGQTMQVNFLEPWQIPGTPGVYNVRVWAEAAGEEWPTNDTIEYPISGATWYSYADLSRPPTLVGSGRRERGVLFHPANFHLGYPITIYRVRAKFYELWQSPWRDTSFVFTVYTADGSTVLARSDTLEALTGQPGPMMAADLQSPLVLNSGDFLVATKTFDLDGRPNGCSDNSSQGRSYQGAPGSWEPYTAGEWYISIAMTGIYGVEEQPGSTPSAQPLTLTASPNPSTGVTTVHLSSSLVPHSSSLALYDASGRLVQHSSLVIGNSSFRLDLRSMPAGVYMVRLSAGSFSATQKLVLQR